MIKKRKNHESEAQEALVGNSGSSFKKLFRNPALILILNEFFIAHPSVLSSREIEAKTNLSHATAYRAISQLLELNLIALDKKRSNKSRYYYQLTFQGSHLSKPIQEFNKALVQLYDSKRAKKNIKKKVYDPHKLPLKASKTFIEWELIKVDSTYNMLNVLYQHYPASFSLEDLKKKTGLSRTILKTSLTRLLKWKFITFIAKPSKKTSNCVRLTAKGKIFIIGVLKIAAILQSSDSSDRKVTISLREGTESSKKLAHDPLLLKQFEHYINANLDILLREAKIYREPSLAGLRFSFTGRFRIFSRTGARDLVEKYGGVYSEIVTPNLHYLVAGTLRDSNTRYNDAKKLGIKIITEQDFLDVLNRIDFLRRTIQKNIIYSRDYLTGLH